MIGRASSFLGLAFSDRGIACAEVSAGGERRTVRRIATFVFTPELSLEKPDAAGVALATFLREKRFTSSRVVAGVPARWLIASEKEIPPANETAARAAMRMQAERAGSSGEGHEIVFDFAGKPNAQIPSRVLLVGIAKQQFERVNRLLDVAGLAVIAITSTGLTLAGNLKSSETNAAMLVLGDTSGEMVIRSEGEARSLRHVSMTPNGQGLPAIAPLGAELRRAMAMGFGNGAPPAKEVLLLDGVGLGAQQLSELSDRSGYMMRSGDELKLLGLTADAATTARTGSDEKHPIGFFAPAVSLALSGSKPDSLPLDFSHSRLAVASTRKLGRNAILGIVAGVLILAGIGYLYKQVNDSQHTLDGLNAQLKSMDQQAGQAQSLVDKVSYARGYYDLRPSSLECLRQFTLMFHDDEKIWVNNFNLKDDGKGSMLGKASDQETALKLIERLKKNPKFSNLEHLDVHEVDARTHEWQFSFNFTYNFAE